MPARSRCQQSEGGQQRGVLYQANGLLQIPERNFGIPSLGRPGGFGQVAFRLGRQGCAVPAPLFEQPHSLLVLQPLRINLQHPAKGLQRPAVPASFQVGQAEMVDGVFELPIQFHCPLKSPHGSTGSTFFQFHHPQKKETLGCLILLQGALQVPSGLQSSARGGVERSQ